MIVPSNEEITRYITNSVQKKRRVTPQSALLIMFWNEQQVQELSSQYPNPKKQIIDFMVSQKGERIPDIPESVVFFEDCELFERCKKMMKSKLPWAFTQVLNTSCNNKPLAEVAHVTYGADEPNIQKTGFFSE